MASPSPPRPWTWAARRRCSRSWTPTATTSGSSRPPRPPRPASARRSASRSPAAPSGIAWRGYARAMAPPPARQQALRAVAGGVDAAAVAAEARELGVMGWVRPTGEIHAEGPPEAVQALIASLGDAGPTEPARVERHEQFAI